MGSSEGIKTNPEPVLSAGLENIFSYLKVLTKTAAFFNVSPPLHAGGGLGAGGGGGAVQRLAAAVRGTVLGATPCLSVPQKALASPFTRPFTLPASGSGCGDRRWGGQRKAESKTCSPAGFARGPSLNFSPPAGRSLPGVTSCPVPPAGAPQRPCSPAAGGHTRPEATRYSRRVRQHGLENLH